MNIYEKLSAIQSELNAPKTRLNKFGGYYYRNTEDIYEALKPLLVKHKVTLTMNDGIMSVDGRFYVEATATLVDNEDPASISSIVKTAYARESDFRKGMDDSQLTGASSTYARKYCLGGMFLIDDIKDADSMNNNVEEEPTALPDYPQKSFDDNIEKWTDLIANGKKTPESIIKFLSTRSTLSEEQVEALKGLGKKGEE